MSIVPKAVGESPSSQAVRLSAIFLLFLGEETSSFQSEWFPAGAQASWKITPPNSFAIIIGRFPTRRNQRVAFALLRSPLLQRQTYGPTT